MINTLSGALGLDALDAQFWVPMILVAFLYLLIMLRVVFEGFDIGIGVLLPFMPSDKKLKAFTMLNPWRHANELWMFLAIGLVIAAFPNAIPSIATVLYLPLVCLALGALVRSVAFEFRLRSPLALQPRWSLLFSIGSWLVAMADGLIVSVVIVNFNPDSISLPFMLFFALCGVASYGLLGAAWLIMRTEQTFNQMAIKYARICAMWVAAGVTAVSITLASINNGILLKWGASTKLEYVIAVWVVLFSCFVLLEWVLVRLKHSGSKNSTIPYVLSMLIFSMVILGIIYSFFPYIILDHITIWDGANSTHALNIVLTLLVFILPFWLAFNLWVYAPMFRRKS